MTDILFFIEHRVREFDAAAAIKRHLEARHGLSTIVAAVGQREEPAIANARPQMVVLPWARNAETWSVLRSIVNTYPRAVFFDMCWEQILLSHVVEAKAPKGRFAKERVLHHTWGSFRTEYLKQQGIPAERIFENGNPLYTLYLERYRGLYPVRAELAARHNLDPNKPWVLFPENYGWSFLSEAQIRKRFVRKGLSEERAFENRRFQIESRRAAFEWFSGINGPIEFILRPRPAITAAAYQAAFESEGIVPGKSVRIIKDGPVREWIHAADLVMSSFSTTLLEAAIAGKPAFAVEPVPFVADIGDVEWVQQLDRVTSREAFEELLRDPRSVPPTRRSANFARGIAHSCDDALIGAADIIKRILDSQRGVQIEPYIIPEPPMEKFKRFRRRAREWLGLPKRTKPFETAKSERLSDAEVESRTAQVDALFAREKVLA